MIPATLEVLERETVRHGFSMPSERLTGELLRLLAATKPGGRLLELGTGTGLATAWLLDGMGDAARLDSVEMDPAVLAIARQHLDADDRVTFHECDAERFILRPARDAYDLIFADAWPGKYSLLDETLALLTLGGIYVLDDMSPQPNWPSGHDVSVERLLNELAERNDLALCRLDYSTGVTICARSA